MQRAFVSLSFLALSSAVHAQLQGPAGVNATGLLVKQTTRTVNAMALAQAALQTSGTTAPRKPEFSLFLSTAIPRAEIKEGGVGIRTRLHPARAAGPVVTRRSSESTSETGEAKTEAMPLVALPSVPALPIQRFTTGVGFNGLTHFQQRNANRGNQYNIEPPNPSIGVSNRFVLLGVNNAVQVYSLTGAPLLPAVISTNELFKVAPAIDRTTGLLGPYGTDMRVIYDHTIDRFMVIQRSLDENPFTGDPVGTSKIYIAITKTNDPTGDWDNYVLDTTEASQPGCPCVADYPMIAFDQHGLHISSNAYNLSEQFVRAQIHSISKTQLAASAATPTMYLMRMDFPTGYEFAIHPAMTPPGASFFLASGGVQFFASTFARFSAGDTKLMIFALQNTSSLNTATPNLTISSLLVNTVPYAMPQLATQKAGAFPLGTSLFQELPGIDGGDPRIQAASYAGGRLWLTWATPVIDTDGNEVVGGAFAIFSPTIRGGVLAANSLRQGYFGVRGQHLLRSAVAVTGQSRGAIAVTLVGPDYFPSAAYLPIDLMNGPSVVRLVQEGAAPYDGFTAYDARVREGRLLCCRWGDYNTPVVAGDGSIWMTIEYIPDLPRSPLSNWGTYITRYVP